MRTSGASADELLALISAALEYVQAHEALTVLYRDQQASVRIKSRAITRSARAYEQLKKACAAFPEEEELEDGHIFGREGNCVMPEPKKGGEEQ